MKAHMTTSLHTWQEGIDTVSPTVRAMEDGTPILDIGDFTWYATDAELIDLRDKLLEQFPVEASEAEPEHEHRPMGSIVSDAVGRRFADCACGQRIRAATASVYADWKPVREFLGVPFP